MRVLRDDALLNPGFVVALALAEGDAALLCSTGDALYRWELRSPTAPPARVPLSVQHPWGVVAGSGWFAVAGSDGAEVHREGLPPQLWREEGHLPLSVRASSEGDALWLATRAGAEHALWRMRPSQDADFARVAAPEGVEPVFAVEAGEWRAFSGARVLRLRGGALVDEVPEAAREKLLALRADGTLAYLDRSSVLRLRGPEGRASDRALQAFEKGLSGLRFSRDGARLVALSREDELLLFDVAAGKVLARRAPSESCYAYGDEVLYAASGQRVRRLDARTLAPLDGLALDTSAASLCLHGEHLWAVQPALPRALALSLETLQWEQTRPLVRVDASREGTLLTAGGTGPCALERDGNAVRVPSKGEPRNHLACVSPDGSRVLTLESRGVRTRLCLLEPGGADAELDAQGGLARSACFSPDGALLAVVLLDKEVALFDGRTGARLGSLGKKQRVGFWRVCFTEGSDGLLAAGRWGVGLLGLEEGPPRWSRRFSKARATALCTTAEGSLAIVAFHDGKVRALRVGDGEEVQRWTMPSMPVALAADARGRLFVALADTGLAVLEGALPAAPR